MSIKIGLISTCNEHRAAIAKAAIALANHGGGYIIIGLSDGGQELQSYKRPDAIPEITQDAVNSAIKRYATPEFHCEMHNVTHPATNVMHPVIAIPNTLTEPAMSRRNCGTIINQNRCYIRKPGPRSEEPLTGEEWRALIQRCVMNRREDMLEAIRSIVLGRVETQSSAPNALDELQAYCEEAHARWQEITKDEPESSPARFPKGYYEMGFSLISAEAVPSFNDLRARLLTAGNSLTGWPPFLILATPDWTPYIYDNYLEAWLGRSVPNHHSIHNPAHCDFWRASPKGRLYTIRGYIEDSLDPLPSGIAFDVTLPVWRIGEGILFANHFAETYENVESIAIWCRFLGLRDRSLTSIDGTRTVFGNDTSSANQIILTAKATPQQIKDNLAEILHHMLTPLYERFNFFQLPFALVEEELARMRKRTL